MRRTSRFGKIRTGHPDAVIGPPINAHVNPLRHVTAYALRSGVGLAIHENLVEVMRGHIIFIHPVALGTKLIAGVAELKTVRVMAITAADVSMIHLALHKGTIDVILFQHLSVGIIDTLPKQGGRGMIEKFPVSWPDVMEREPPGMAQSTLVYEFLGGQATGLNG